MTPCGWEALRTLSGGPSPSGTTPSRGTREIHLNVFLWPSELERVLVHLVPLGVERPPETTTPRIPVVGVMCPWDETHIDLFFAYDEEFFDSVRSRIEEHLFIVRDVEHRLPILSAEDLTVFKVTFDRPKDWVDIRHMLEEKALDRDYVQQWLLHLRGDRELAQDPAVPRPVRGSAPGGRGSGHRRPAIVSASR